MTALLLTTGLVATAAPTGAATPDAWAADVCGAVDTWVESARSASTTAANTSITDAKSAKRALTKLVNAIDRATAAAGADVKQAGAPSGAGGKEVASVLRDQLQQAKRSVAQAKKALRKASAKDLAKLVGTARGAQDAVEAALESRVNALLAGGIFDSPELLTAANAEPACAPAGDDDGIGVTLTPPDAAPGTEIAVAPSGVDAAAADECALSSTFVSELLGPDGALLATGGETVLVPDGVAAGAVRLICYLPDATGRRVIRGLCAAFADPTAGCPPALRVVVSQGVLEVEQALSEGFNPVLTAIGG